MKNDSFLSQVFRRITWCLSMRLQLNRRIEKIYTQGKPDIQNKPFVDQAILSRILNKNFAVLFSDIQIYPANNRKYNKMHPGIITYYGFWRPQNTELVWGIFSLFAFLIPDSSRAKLNSSSVGLLLNTCAGSRSITCYWSGFLDCRNAGYYFRLSDRLP